MATETLRPNGAGDYENIDNVTGDGTGTHYTTVDEETPDDDTTQVYTESTSQLKDAYALQDTSIASGSTINSVTVYFRIKRYSAYHEYAQPFLRLDSNETAGTELDIQGTFGWVTYSEALSRPGGGNWAVSDLNDLQVCIGLRAGGGYARCTQAYVEVDYTAVTEKTSSDSGSGVDAYVSLEKTEAKSSSDTGSGIEGTPLPSAFLAGSETGSGIEALVARLLAALDTGTSAEVGGLLKDLLATELGRGSDSLAAKIEMPTKGGGMKLWT